MANFKAYSTSQEGIPVFLAISATPPASPVLISVDLWGESSQGNFDDCRACVADETLKI